MNLRKPKLHFIALIKLIFALGALCIRASAEDTARYSTGNRFEDPGYSTVPWQPYDRSNSFVWVAETCLGYFETRDLELLAPLPSTFDKNKRFEILAPDQSARLQVFNFPFDEYGVFRCNSTTYPEIERSSENIAEIEKWINLRLTKSSNWVGTFDPSNPTIFGDKFRNEERKATIRIQHDRDKLSFSLSADYFGPPIIFDEFQW